MSYDAGIYSYMWSRVLSQDMFSTRFAKEGIFNTITGMDYRNKILMPGTFTLFFYKNKVYKNTYT